MYNNEENKNGKKYADPKFEILDLKLGDVLGESEQKDPLE